MTIYFLKNNHRIYFVVYFIKNIFCYIILNLLKIKTNILLDEILHETDSDKLLSRVDKGIKNRFSKILEIFDDNKTLFSTKISTTLSQNFTEEKYIIKKSRTKKIKNNNKIFSKKVYISNHFGIIISQSNYI